VLLPLLLLLLLPPLLLLQVHLGLLEGRVSHIVWPPARMGRVAVVPQPERILHTDADTAGISQGYS
jgi:hypothetical protein